MNHCKACGSRQDVGRPSRWTLETLEIEAVPAWLSMLCNRCMMAVAHVGYGDGEQRERPVEPRDLEDHLARACHRFAARAARQRPMDICEVLRPGYFDGNENDYQCCDWAADEVDGHKICATCRHWRSRGRQTYFVGDRVARPTPYLIWASDRAEFINRANEIIGSIAA